MLWKAKWIWIDGDASPRNQYVCFRKTLNLTESPSQAVLHISADSRYRLFVNGEWIGDGPSRSWPWRQGYDTYEIGCRLLPGRNSIAALVTHYGECTFQYVSGRGGFLCQIEMVSKDGTHETVGTDGTWKARPETMYSRPTARISVQLPFEEQVDSRLEEKGWTDAAFKDGKWRGALEIGSVGSDPWKEMSPRTIPFLTRRDVYPERIISLRCVKVRGQVETLDSRATLRGGDVSANPRDARAVYISEVLSPSAQEVVFLNSGTDGFHLWLNGKELGHYPRREEIRAKLRKGSNFVGLSFEGGRMWTAVALACETKHPIRFQLPGHPESPSRWLLVGHFRPEQKEGFDLAHRVSKLEDLDHLRDFAQPFPPEDQIPLNTYAITRNQAPLPKKTAQVLAPSAFLTDSEDYTTVKPSGADVEFLVDFGRQTIGYVELELDAPAGAIVDGLFFEAVENGENHYTDGNHNSFRLVCRGGRQRFTSYLRRGMRYGVLTLREFTSPVNLRFFRVKESTYPAEDRGRFHCSDPLLNELWKVGRHTLRLCSEDTFTDCPLYEQTYWVGDARIEALVSYAAWGPLPIVPRCIDLAGESLTRSQFPESQVPSGWSTILPAWSLLWVLMAEEYYRYSGDIKAVREYFGAVQKTLDRFLAKCTNHGLLSISAWNLFDWAPMDYGSDTVVHNSVFLVGALAAGEKLARAMGNKVQADEWAHKRENLIKAINDTVWSEEKGAYVDALHEGSRLSEVVSQQTNSIAVLFGVPTPERLKRIQEWPETVPEYAVKVGSPFAMFFSLEALARQGRYDAILRVIRDRWGMMLEHGATTFWETFPGFEGHWMTRSHCHAWSAGPTYFLTTCQLGIVPLEPGFSQIRIAPRPVDLKWAEGIQSTPHGDVSVSWRRLQDSFSLKAEIPVTCKAEIVLPVRSREYPVVKVNGKTPTDRGLVTGIGKVEEREDTWIISPRAGGSIEVIVSK